MKKLSLLSVTSLLSAVSLAGCGKTPTPIYTINFKDYDSTILETVKVEQGKMPQYSGVTPTREEYQGKRYTFSGWTPELTKATEDADYFAKYDVENIEYTVTFDTNGGVGTYPSQTHYWGEKVTKPSVDPTKPSDEVYNYEFLYWYTTDVNKAYDFNKEVVTDSFTLTAKWKSSYISYVVSFVSNCDTPVNPIEVRKNTKIESLPTPSRKNDNQYTYTFGGWYVDEELTQPYDTESVVTGNITLYAKWEQTLNKYQVTFKNYDGTTLSGSQEYEYGQNPVCTQVPVKGDDDYCSYRFIGWTDGENNYDKDQTLPAVEDNKTYTAIFEEYGIKWTHHAGIDSGCETYGLKEYWSNAKGEVVVTMPTGVISEGTPSSIEDVETIYANDPEDIRLLEPTGHAFDAISGECIKYETVKVADVFYTNENPDDGDYKVTETSKVIEGFDTIYQFKHSYHNSTDGLTIAQTFTDYSLENVISFEFYVELVSIGTWLIANEDNNNVYEMHPHSVFGGAGVIKGTRIEEGWLISANGFFFRQRTDGAKLASYTYANPNATLNDLFHCGNPLSTDSEVWGASTINISEIKVTSVKKCGTRSAIYDFIDDPTLLTPTKSVKVDAKYGNVYEISENKINVLFGDYNISTLTSFKFMIINPEKDHMVILSKNGESYKGGSWGGENVEVKCEKLDQTTWKISRIGANFVCYDAVADDYTYVESYEVSDVTTLKDIFEISSYSPTLYITDIVTSDAVTGSRYSITSTAFNTYVNDAVNGNATLVSDGESKLGVGNLYTYTHTYSNGVPFDLRNMFNNVDLTGIKSVEFYIDSLNGEFQIAGDTGATDSSYELHPNEPGAEGPGYIKIVQTSAGNWTFHSYGFKFRPMFKINGAHPLTNSFSVTGRTTLRQLINIPSDGYSKYQVRISDIIVTK